MDLAPNGKQKPPIELTGRDGNAFSIMGVAVAAMRLAGWSGDERGEYLEEARSGDYDHLLQTTMRYCDVI